MQNLRAVFLYELNDRIRDEPQTLETNVNVCIRMLVLVLPRKYRHTWCGILHNDISKTKPKGIINEVKNILETNITKTPIL